MADTPMDPREYARQKFREVLASVGKTPTGRGSGPTDEEYYLDRIMQEGGWDNGYDWADRIKRGIAGTVPPLGTPNLPATTWGPVPGQNRAGSPWPNIQTSLPTPPTMSPLPDLGGNTGVSGYAPGGLPVPGIDQQTQNTNRVQQPNDQRSPNVYGSQQVDVNNIVERALQNLLTQD